MDVVKGTVIFILGGPGCGKGTQCEMMAAKYGLAHLSTGDLLREEVAKETELGMKAKTIMDNGELVPMVSSETRDVEMVLELLKLAMVRKDKEGCKGYLIDGYPREENQLKAFEEQIKPCDRCIYFHASDKVLTKRLLRRGKSSGRSDDNAATIKKRLCTYHDLTSKVINHYKHMGAVYNEINSEREIKVVFKDVCAKLDKWI